MADRSNYVVRKFAGGEGLMAAFVSQNPDARHDTALRVPVDRPQENRGPGRQETHISNPGCEVGKNGNDGQVRKQVTQRSQQISLEAMRRNCIFDVFQGKFRRFKRQISGTVIVNDSVSVWNLLRVRK